MSKYEIVHALDLTQSVHAKISIGTVGQCKPCGDKRCKCCLQLQHAQVFHSKTTVKEYKIFCNVNCKTPGLDTAALTSVSLMLLGRRNATTGGSGNNLASASLFSISFRHGRIVSDQVHVRFHISTYFLVQICKNIDISLPFTAYIG
jgi:hypothetical protein